MVEDQLSRPPNYSPPTSGAELLQRYSGGERYFARSSLKNACFAGEDLENINLTGSYLSQAEFSRANLRGAILDGACLREASFFNACLASSQMESADLYNSRFCDADLAKSSLCSSSFWCADLDSANLREANLSRASLRFADLTKARLDRAILVDANLVGAQLVNTVLDDADISGSKVYGVSAWSVSLNQTKQQGLIITDDEESTVTVDDLEVAQFVYLLLRNQNLRKVIDTVTSKMVLILGRFTIERMEVLRLIKSQLDGAGYLAVVFDFDKPASRDLTETIRTLAHLSKFIVADLTEARSIPQELMTIVPFLPSVPVKPIISDHDDAWVMFGDLQRYPWVLPIWRYSRLRFEKDQILGEIVRPIEDWQAKLLR